jgi:hypothetical protein
MLTRVTGALFEGDAGDDVQLVVRAQNNNGTEAATFEYAEALLTTETIQGHPGCSFTLEPSIHQFETIVVFAANAPASARYDLLQVNSAGGLTLLGESVVNGGGSPLIGFGIDGIPTPVRAAVRSTRGAAGRIRLKRARTRKTTRKRVKARATVKRRRPSARKTTAARKRPAAARKRPAAAKRRKTARKSAASRKRR